MATLKGAPDADALVSEIDIAARPENVFRALVDPEQVVRWWGQAGVYRCTKFESDLRTGGKWRSAGVDGEGRNFEVMGEYLEVDPPRLLMYTWVASWTGDMKTTVRWELEPTKQGTRVRICHGGFGARPEVAQNYRGWPRMLKWLRSFLESGETVEHRKPLST